MNQGEVVGLVGPNGGGKSTLLYLIAGLLKPTSGTITIGGLPAHRLAREAAGSVGLVTAQPGVYPALTVSENLAYFAGLYGRTVDPVVLDGLVGDLDLTRALHQRVGLLSSGQQQKVSLLRALCLEPAVLLFDEPTANLDPVSADVVARAITGRRGAAVVLCTHDLALAEQRCDRVLVFNRTVRHTHVPAPSPRITSPLLALFEAAT